MVDPKIIREIDKTLDQLIENAEAISNTDVQSLSDSELFAFQQRQESLLHHLLSVDQFMAKTQSPHNPRTACAQIRAKRIRFQTLESKNNSRLEQRSILSKRKKKQFLDPRYRKSLVNN